MSRPSLNARCSELILAAESGLDVLAIHRIADHHSSRIYDFGVRSPGTIQGGKLLAELCLGGLASVEVSGPRPVDPKNLSYGARLPFVSVRTDHPLQACMHGQYAGWPVAAEGYFAMASGPGRILRGREEIFERYPATDDAGVAWIVLEAPKLPDNQAIELMAAECGIERSNLRIAIARTASTAGTLQIVARSIETTLHKLFELKFDLDTIRSAAGSAPFPPVGRDDLQSIGWTNDAILFGGEVWLAVDCEQSGVDNLIDQIPSNSSADFGRPFSEVFEACNRDFYAIDRMLFSPASITIHNLRSGITRFAGEYRGDLLIRSFFHGFD